MKGETKIEYSVGVLVVLPSAQRRKGKCKGSRRCHTPYPWKMGFTYIWVGHENIVGSKLELVSNYVKTLENNLR